ncbi:MAG: nucleotidyltransferase substrate binding protein [Chlamydiota bacterium]
MAKDIRWKQRFENLERAFSFLEKAVSQKEYDELQQAGLVQCFEFSFELAWKTMKDFLETMGISASYPREIIKESFKSGLLEDGHIWIQMLDKRNELSHTYNDDQAKKAVRLIREDYFPAIKQVYHKLKNECDR